MKNLYTENYETLKKETKELRNKKKYIWCSWLEKINIIKMSKKTIYRLNAIPIKILMTFFTDFETNNSEISMESQIQKKKKKTWIAKAIQRKNKAGCTTSIISNYIAKLVIKTMWYCHKNRHMHPWNSIEISEINPYVYGQLIYNKKARTINVERTISLTDGVVKAGQPNAKKWN